MVRVICRAKDCLNWENGFCVSEQITYDPENGCLTFEGVEELFALDNDIFDDMKADSKNGDSAFALEGEDELYFGDDDDDDW
ncbi:MAG: hypothetical protein AAF629_21555 [Chloroflexota bacterium]